YRIPAVVFLVTDYVDRPRLFWWDRLHLAIHHARVSRLSLPWCPERTLRLGRSGNDLAMQECASYLTRVRVKVQERAVEELIDALGDPELPDLGRHTMNWDEVRDAMDVTTFGGHTHTHPAMTHVDLPRLDLEIRMCRDRI